MTWSTDTTVSRSRNKQEWMLSLFLVLTLSSPLYLELYTNGQTLNRSIWCFFFVSIRNNWWLITIVTLLLCVVLVIFFLFINKTEKQKKLAANVLYFIDVKLKRRNPFCKQEQSLIIIFGNVSLKETHDKRFLDVTLKGGLPVTWKDFMCSFLMKFFFGCSCDHSTWDGYDLRAEIFSKKTSIDRDSNFICCFPFSGVHSGRKVGFRHYFPLGFVMFQLKFLL